MNQIFQNMTKGEWETDASFIQYIDSKGDANEMYQNIQAGSNSVQRIANAQAIVNAVNNTYGKGINPESVGKMRLYAELEEKFQNGEVFEYNGNKYKRSVNKVEAVALLNKLRTEALTASKL